MSERLPGSYSTPGDPQQTDLGHVESVLRDLWSATQDAGEERQEDVLQMRTLNLVVYLPGRDALSRLRGSLAEIAAAHPGRILLLCPDPAAPEGQISAQASIYCYRTRSKGQQVCGEEVTLTARGDAVDELHTAVHPLLISDLPVVLWWTDEPGFSEHRFQALAETATRVLLDSATFSRQHRQLREYAALVAQKREPAIHDLNWTRITFWRELIAQFYDDPAARSALDQVSEVVVEYGATEDQRESPALIQSLLLVGWLSSRLGWQPAEAKLVGDELSLLLRQQSRELRASIRPVPHTSPLELAGARLASPQSSFALSCEQPSRTMQVQVELHGRGQQRRLVRWPDQSLAALVRDELSFFGHDRVYEQALAVADQLLGMLGETI